MKYFKHAMCPVCRQEIKMEQVQLTAYFSCPQCSADISISAAYHRFHVAFAVVGALVIAIVIGRHVDLFAGLVAFLPSEALLVFLVAYVGKYIIPPTLIPIAKMRPPGVLNL
jgi:hypothetical protein